MKELSYAERFLGEENKEVVEAIKELYITTRKRFILQYVNKKGESGYRVPRRAIKQDGKTVSYQPLVFSDGWLHSHVKGVSTVGTYSNPYFTKFICFDVDTKDESRETTLNLVNTLEEMNISREDIHVSLSGDKGYHVEIFFDRTISTENLKSFYNKVLERSGDKPSEVEFRPTDTQGVKIPLGIHLRTGNRCWYVDNTTLKPIEDSNYILGIRRVDSELFISEQLELEDVIFLKEEEADEFEKLTDGVSLSAIDLLGIKKDLKVILERNELIEKDSRNKITLAMSMYLRDEGKELKTAEGIINSVMLNTKETMEGYIDSSTTKIQRETRKIVRYVYRKGLTLVRRSNEVRLYKEEILDVLSIKKWEAKKLYLTMIMFYKRMGYLQNQEFPMSYSMMSAMGNTKNISRCLSLISNLQSLGYVEIRSRGEFDAEKTKREGKFMRKVNRYKIKKVYKQDGASILIEDCESDIEMEGIISEMFEEEELRVLLPKNQFYKVKNYAS